MSQSQLFEVCFEIKADGTMGEIVCGYQNTGLTNEELLLKIAHCLVTGFEMQNLTNTAKKIINP